MIRLFAKEKDLGRLASFSMSSLRKGHQLRLKTTFGDQSVQVLLQLGKARKHALKPPLFSKTRYLKVVSSAAVLVSLKRYISSHPPLECAPSLLPPPHVAFRQDYLYWWEPWRSLAKCRYPLPTAHPGSQ